MKRPIPGQKHHWFPKAMAKSWAASDGLVSRTNSRGQTIRKHPSGIGYYPDHHNVLWDGGSFWDATFEPAFDAADNAFPKVIQWLEVLAAEHPKGSRINGVAIAEQRVQLAECLASLIVRSPRLRHLSETYTAQSQREFLGLSSGHNLHQTAGATLRQCLEPFARDIRTGGKFAFLIAEKADFLFGDGFMSNHSPAPDRVLSPMAMVAFTPRVAVLWFSPIQYPSNPEGVTIALSNEEIVGFNDIVQIYAKDNLFHIGDPPELHEAYRAKQHFKTRFCGTDYQAEIVERWKSEVLQVRAYK